MAKVRKKFKDIKKIISKLRLLIKFRQKIMKVVGKRAAKMKY